VCRLRSLGRYGARCVRSLWKISGLFVDCLIRFGRLFNERLLRWRGGSICCAVSRWYRNAFRLFGKTLCASLLRPWEGKECLTPPRQRGAREGRAGQESLERAPSRSDGYTIIPTSYAAASGDIALAGSGQVPPNTDRSRADLTASNPPFTGCGRLREVLSDF
jgi:hypothetical protein